MKTSIFPDAADAYDRYKSLLESDPFATKREKHLKNYNRNPWRRKRKGCEDRLEPNFGQYKGKLDSAIGVYINVFTERGVWVKITPKYVTPDLQKIYSDRITQAFHRYFIKPWEDRITDEVLAAFDIVMSGKAVEHWPSKGCIYTENVPVERVFPDTGAGMDPSKWAYVFIEKDFYISEILQMIEDGDDNDEGFNVDYLKRIMKEKSAYVKPLTTAEADKQNKGDRRTSEDEKICIVYAYIKENYKKKNKVNKYCFPATVKNYDSRSGQSGQLTGEETKPEYLCKDEEYCESLSNVVAVRASQITRSYWRFNSLAEQLFLSTALYDKSMSLAIRGFSRSMVMYFQTDRPEVEKKLMKMNDEEIQVLDPDVKLLQQNVQSGLKDVVEITRQIMIDTDNSLALSQSPGSQNVKGYAITAEEASIRAQKEGEAEGVSVKLLMYNDVRLYREIFRRAIDVKASPEYKDAVKAFEDEMKMYNIPEDIYSYKNLFFTPFFVTGGSQSARINNAQGALSALAMNPSNPGQQQAQRDLVAAFVGTENIDAYISEKTEVNPIIIKVGSENEDLDNPDVNPNNIPVLPTDKHAQELPIHIADYEYKLKIAQGQIQAAMQNPSKIRKVLLLSIAQRLIQAQDGKGGHIQAHIQAMANSKDSMEAIKPLIAKFAELQKGQDALTSLVDKANQEIDSSMQESDMNSEQLRHAQSMNQLTETHAKNINDIALGKHIEKMKGMDEQREFALESNKESAAIKLAEKEATAELKINQQQKSNEQSNTTRKDSPAS